MIIFRRHRRWAVRTVFAFALLGAGLFLACGKKSEPAFERPPPPVTVAQAASRAAPLYIDAVAKIAAREVVTVQPQVSGRIERIHFTDGAELRAGQLLFSLDARPYQAQLDQADADLAQAEAALALAEANFFRVENISDPRAVSRQDYDAKKSALAAARAQLAHRRAARESARLNLEYCAIHSPIAGRAGQRAVDAGNIVTANSGALLVIQNLDPVYIDFSLSESELGAVQRQLAKGELRVEVRLPEEPNDARIGKLTFIDNAVQEGSGTIKLRATLANRDRRFWPGRFAKVRLILATLPDAVLVPAEAAQQSAKGPFVYVIKSDGSAELRPVKLGQRHDQRIVIEAGVKAGERIVVSGQLGVMPGGKVRIVENVTTGSANAPAKGGAGK